MMSDSASVCSSASQLSASNVKMECPYCIKSLQTKAIFGHIRKFHNDELVKSTNKRWIDDAENGKPLRVWWSKKNDFDEDEDTIVYVCLSTNKTFVSEQKAVEHFKKDKAALKDHNKQLKQLRKDFTAMKKAKAKEVKPLTAFQLARDANDPALARAIWKGILHHKRVCEVAMMLCHRRGYSNATLMYMYDERSHRCQEITFPEFNDKYNDLMNKIQHLREQQCLDVKPLLNVWGKAWTMWSNSFRESLFDFSNSLLESFPTYNQFIGDDASYGFATEEMEGVDF